MVICAEFWSHFTQFYKEKQVLSARFYWHRQETVSCQLSASDKPLADWFSHVIHHSLGLAMALLWDLCHFMPPSTEPARQDIDLGRAERTESLSVWFGFYCEECECQRLWFWGFSDNPGRARVTLSCLGLTPRSHLETGSCNIVSAKRVLDQPLGSYGPVLPTNHCGVWVFISSAFVKMAETLQLEIYEKHLH